MQFSEWSINLQLYSTDSEMIKPKAHSKNTPQSITWKLLPLCLFIAMMVKIIQWFF